ncbi:hypothetical protein D3C86_1705220 [compost metagenome]
MRNPLMRPHPSPPPSPIRKASSGGNPAVMARRPMSVEVNTMMAPTDRSMPAVRITSVWAMPIMPMMVTC